MLLAWALAETVLAAVLVGAAETTAELPDTITLPLKSPPRKPPKIGDLLPSPPVGVERLRFPVVEDAVEVLRASRLFAGEDFQATAEAVKEGAFAITGEHTEAALREVRDKLADQMAKGLDHDEFIADAVKILDTSASHADQIFRNNIGQALGVGMEKALRHPVVVDAFPYRKYFATHDDRVRATHIALESSGLNGTQIYNKDDPVWRTFAPPWEWACRCAFSPYGVKQAAKAGVQEAIEWLARAEAMADEQGGRAASYFIRTAPPEYQFVAWPTHDGKRIMPPPGWVRGGIAAA